MDARAQLVFRGETEPGHDRATVQRALAQALKLDGPQVEALFSGTRAILKQSLPLADALRYARQLARIGALVHVEPMPADEAASAVAPRPPAEVEPELQLELQARALAAAPPASAAAAAVEPAAPLPAAEPDEVVCPNCGERQPRREICGACGTDMARAVAARIEAARLERQQRLAELRSGGGVEVDELPPAPLEPDRSLRALLLGFEGRISPLRYATASVGLLTCMLLIAAFVLGRPGAGRLVAAVLLLAPLLFQSMRLTALRCQDCGGPRWWRLLALVPYVGTVGCLLLTRLPSAETDNEFGPPPEPGDPRHLAVAVGACVVLGGWGFYMGYQSHQQERMQQLSLSMAESDARQMAEAAASAAILAASAPDAADESEPAQLKRWMPNEEAAAAFRTDYEPARVNKAFAVSAGGGWGWKAGARNASDAAHAALADCAARQPAFAATCHLVNVNGRWPKAR